MLLVDRAGEGHGEAVGRVDPYFHADVAPACRVDLPFAVIWPARKVMSFYDIMELRGRS